MERLVSVIEAFFRPRDNYGTGARAAAFLLAAVAVVCIEEALDNRMNPWLIALLVAGLLNLFALILSTFRTRRERPFVVLNEVREHRSAELGVSVSQPPVRITAHCCLRVGLKEHIR